MLYENTTRLIPKLAHFAGWLAFGTATLLLFRAATEENLSWILWMIATALAGIVTATRWPYGALFLLIAASTTPRFFVEIFGWKARPEHFAVAIVFLAVVASYLRSGPKLRLEIPDYCVLAYVAINYISSTLGSFSPSETLRWALLNNLAILPYFLIRFFVRDEQTLRKAFRILLAVGVAECGYGILCYISYHVFGTTTGMEIGQYMTDVAGLYGSLAEANHFGAYAGCAAVSVLAVYLIGQRRIVYLICFFVASLAEILSLSRGALIATVVAGGWACWQARDSEKRFQWRTAVFVLAAGLILPIVIPAVGGVIQERFKNLINEGLTEDTTIGRLVEAQEALQEFSEHPLLGTGTASFQLSFDWGKYLPEMQGKATWVGNVTIRIFHDTGLVGASLILVLVIWLCWRIRLVLRARVTETSILVALSAGALLYAISFQATDGTLDAFPWIQLGLLSSGATLPNHCTNECKYYGERW